MQLKWEASAGALVSPLSPPSLCAVCSAVTREVVNDFFGGLGKPGRDVCVAVPDGSNDTARWTVCSSGSDRWLGHRMSKGLVTY